MFLKHVFGVLMPPRATIITKLAMIANMPQVVPHLYRRYGYDAAVRISQHPLSLKTRII